MIKRISIVSGLLFSMAWPITHAQSLHGEHTSGMSHGVATDNAMPIEGGQSTFAAIIEIVAMLEADPKTRWSEVDIDSLRSHLLDMNNLILLTTATTQETNNNTVQFTVKGTGDGLEAIHRMTSAHAQFIQQSRGWEIDTELTDTGASVRVTTNNDVSKNRLKAMGFYGFMSLDSHHQEHHLLMAKGQSH